MFNIARFDSSADVLEIIRAQTILHLPQLRCLTLDSVPHCDR